MLNAHLVTSLDHQRSRAVHMKGRGPSISPDRLSNDPFVVAAHNTDLVCWGAALFSSEHLLMTPRQQLSITLTGLDEPPPPSPLWVPLLLLNPVPMIS